MSSLAFTTGLAHLSPLPAQAEAFSAAFSDYVTGPVRLDTEGMARYVFGQGIDLWLSRLALAEERILGFGYINRTGEIARLAGMGFVPSARGQRVGSSLLQQLVEQSRARGERMMTLEVFEQNPPAVALYRRFGFREKGRLFGWHLNSPAKAPGESLSELGLLQASHAVSLFEYPAVPWQISRHALAKLPPGSRAFALGSSLVAVTNPEAEKPAIRMLHQNASRANWAEMRSLVIALLSRFPEARWSAPAIFPEMFGREVFEPLGFTREPLNQLHMELAL
jgi:GNAT superfamily N-acetyltransferase